jgi:transposase
MHYHFDSARSIKKVSHMEVKMEAVKRLDHLGIVAGIMKDLGIAKIIDELLGVDKQEEVSAGEVIAAMILNGLGFVSKPLMLTPQYFEHKPLEILIRNGVEPEHFNRHKIGRVLDTVSEYGCEKLFSIIALDACKKEKVNLNVGHCDTTSHSLTGEYDVDSDTERIEVTYGHSKAKRPDLKQVVQELMTSRDGGIPFATKVFSGNASDSVILRERAEAIVEAFAKGSERCLTADSKLYCEKSAKTLNKLYFVTRVPSTLKLTGTYINQALEKPDLWQHTEKGYKMQEFAVDCYGIDDQRWVVVYSEQAHARCKVTLQKEVAREKERIDKELFHLRAASFSCGDDAHKKLNALVKKWKYHQVHNVQVQSVKRHTQRGRPTAESAYVFEWRITADARVNQPFIDQTLEQDSCFVLATNSTSEELLIVQVLDTYKGQDSTEKGFAFLKSPNFFVSSLFLKKPSRIDAMLMIMVLSLLIYTIAQRRLRLQLALLKLTVPNQINKEVSNPTMHWIFQLFEGINYIVTRINGLIDRQIQGLKSLQRRVLELLGPNVKNIYQFSGTWG